MMHPLRTIRNFVHDLGPVEQAQVVASTAVVVSMITIVAAMAATSQVPRLMEFISVLTIGLFGFTTVYFSLRYGRQLDAQRRHLLALNTIAEAVNHLTDLHATLESALDKVTGVLKTPHGWIYMLKDDRPALTCTRGAVGDFLSLQNIPPASFTAWALEPRVCRERLREATGTIAPGLKAHGVQFWASIPLHVQERLAGALVVAGTGLAPEASAHTELLSAFGSQISVALGNAYLYEQVRTSKQLYADLFENAPDIYLSVGIDHTILDCNATGTRMLGTTKKDLIGQPCETVFAPERRNSVRALLDALLSRQGGPLILEDLMLGPDGQPFPVHLNSSLVLDAQGNTVNARIVARDITDRKKMEAAVLHAQKIDSIGSLAGGIAHDFNNLLTAILGSASIMRKNMTVRSKLMKYVDIVESSARRGSSLTRQLLTFARQSERQVTPVDIHTIIRNAILLLPRGATANVQVETSFCEESAVVSGDEGQLQQALFNLLLNSRDALDKGGTIRITTEVTQVDAHTLMNLASVKPGPFVAIRVTDTGSGIPREIQGRVFEPFFSTKDQGTGLGLSVVYGVAQSHGGFVNLESSPDCGTTVTLCLPRLASPGPGSPSPRSRQRLPRGTETVLIIDSEESVSEIARETLSALGYTVYVEHNVLAGVEFYRSRHDSIDLILLDAQLAAAGDQPASVTLHSINPACRILTITGDGRGAAEASIAPGDLQQTWVQKPFQRETLALHVRRALDPG